MLFDIGRHVDRLDIFKIGETGSLTPVQELANGGCDQLRRSARKYYALK